MAWAFIRKATENKESCPCFVCSAKLPICSRLHQRRILRQTSIFPYTKLLQTDSASVFYCILYGMFDIPRTESNTRVLWVLGSVHIFRHHALDYWSISKDYTYTERPCISPWNRGLDGAIGDISMQAYRRSPRKWYAKCCTKDIGICVRFLFRFIVSNLALLLWTCIWKASLASRGNSLFRANEDRTATLCNPLFHRAVTVERAVGHVI